MTHLHDYHPHSQFINALKWKCAVFTSKVQEKAVQVGGYQPKPPLLEKSLN